MLHHKFYFLFGLIIICGLPLVALAQECAENADCSFGQACVKQICVAEEAVAEEPYSAAKETEETAEDRASAAESDEADEAEETEETPEACNIDADCASEDEICENKVCTEAEFECKSDAGCAAGRICILRHCVVKGEDEIDEAACIFDKECAAGQMCLNRECVPALDGIPDDAAETDQPDESLPTTAEAGPLGEEPQIFYHQEKLFGLIPAQVPQTLITDPESGALVGTSTPWWASLATRITPSESLNAAAENSSIILNQALASSTACEPAAESLINDYTASLTTVRFFANQLTDAGAPANQNTYHQLKLHAKILPGIAQNCPGDYAEPISAALAELNNLMPERYQTVTLKQAKLFGLFSIMVPETAVVDASSGDTIAEKRPWWAILTKS